MAEPSATDVIEVQASIEEELLASRADLHVSVRGSSLVTAGAALAKAREVAALVSELRSLGLEERDIRVESIQAEVNSGLLTKSSSAVYGLRIRCERLDQLADLLGVITSQKNAELRGITWGYPEDAAQRNRWLAACAEQANVRAQVVAQALGVQVLGVHRFAELAENVPHYPPEGAGSLGYGTPRMRAGRVSAEELGLEVTHAKKIRVAVEVSYRVSSPAR